MKQTLVLFLFSFLAVFCFSQKVKNFFEIQSFKAGFSLSPQVMASKDTLKPILPSPLFGVANLQLQNISVLGFYNFVNPSVGIFVPYNFKKLSPYIVATKNTKKAGGYLGAGALTPVSSGSSVFFFEVGTSDFKNPLLFTGVIIPLQIQIYKRKK